MNKHYYEGMEFRLLQPDYVKVFDEDLGHHLFDVQLLKPGSFQLESSFVSWFPVFRLSSNNQYSYINPQGTPYQPKGSFYRFERVGKVGQYEWLFSCCDEVGMDIPDLSECLKNNKDQEDEDTDRWSTLKFS